MSRHMTFRRRASLVIDKADLMAVRHGLESLFAQEPLRCLPEDQRGTAEIVIAEVLNNIVEHAYSATSGIIEVSVDLAEEGLLCTIADKGAAMPDNLLPQGHAQQIKDLDNLPEGGYGWLLIRSLALDLQYSRLQGHNYLRFRLPAHALPA